MKVGKSVWGGEDLQESLISVLSVLSRQFHAKHLFFFQLHVQILCSTHVVSSEVLYCVQKYCYRQFSSNAEAKVIFFFFWFVLQQDIIGDFCPGVVAGMERRD